MVCWARTRMRPLSHRQKLEQKTRVGVDPQRYVHRKLVAAHRLVPGSAAPIRHALLFLEAPAVLRDAELVRGYRIHCSRVH